MAYIVLASWGTEQIYAIADPGILRIELTLAIVETSPIMADWDDGSTWEGGWDNGNPTMETSPIMADWDTGSTWEGGWDSGFSCWALGREAGIVNPKPQKPQTLKLQTLTPKNFKPKKIPTPNPKPYKLFRV